jgi:hypothetical protein
MVITILTTSQNPSKKPFTHGLLNTRWAILHDKIFNATFKEEGFYGEIYSPLSLWKQEFNKEKIIVHYKMPSSYSTKKMFKIYRTFYYKMCDFIGWIELSVKWPCLYPIFGYLWASPFTPWGPILSFSGIRKVKTFY